MGDSSSGSSLAASDTPPDSSDPDETVPRSGGLFRRIVGALSPSAPDGAMDAAAIPAGLTLPGLMNLRRLRVEDVMIPKADIVSVPLGVGRDDLLDTFRSSNMSRLPVYDGTLDSPLGMIHLKDVALRYGFNGGGREIAIEPLLRPLLYVPPSMSLGVLLQKMQTDRTHMALVIDEYGGVDGLVTIEDLLEQVVGEIEDEHDTETDTFWTEEKPGQYLAIAKTPLDAFETALRLSLTDHDDVDEEEIDTLGGLVFMLAGRVPARGEVVRHPAGHEFEVVDADPRRIKRLRVRLAGPAPAGG